MRSANPITWLQLTCTPLVGLLAGADDQLFFTSQLVFLLTAAGRYSHATESGNFLCKGVGSYTLTGASLKWQQFWALLLKRFHHARRNFTGVISQILLPAIFISIAMTMALSLPKKGDLPALELTPSMFPRPNYIPFANEAKGVNLLAKRLDKTLTLPSGVGATCCLVSANFSFANYSGKVTGKEKYRLSKEKMAEMFDKNCRSSINEVSDEYFKTSNLHLSYIYSKNGSNGTESVSHKDTGRDCRCSQDKMEYVCDRGAAGTHPKELVTITLDTLQNITGRNISKYLLYTTQTFRLHRCVNTSRHEGKATWISEYLSLKLELVIMLV